AAVSTIVGVAPGMSAASGPLSAEGAASSARGSAGRQERRALREPRMRRRLERVHDLHREAEGPAAEQEDVWRDHALRFGVDRYRTRGEPVQEQSAQGER